MTMKAIESLLILVAALFSSGAWAADAIQRKRTLR
jgi:hypothetical protein